MELSVHMLHHIWMQNMADVDGLNEFRDRPCVACLLLRILLGCISQCKCCVLYCYMQWVFQLIVFI